MKDSSRVKVLGIYGSPRKGGNSDQLLDKVLEGAQSAGAEVKRIYARDLKISGCQECGGCEKTGKCVVNDEMQTVYPLLEEADVIFWPPPFFSTVLQHRLKPLLTALRQCGQKKCSRPGPG